MTPQELKVIGLDCLDVMYGGYKLQQQDVCTRILKKLQALDLEGSPQMVYVSVPGLEPWRPIEVIAVHASYSEIKETFQYAVEVKWPRKDGDGYLENVWSHLWLNLIYVRERKDG